MKKVLVTGANRGLGLEFVRSYAHSDWNVIAVARSMSSELDELASTFPVEIVDADVSDKAGWDKILNHLADSALDAVILNAGVYRKISGEGGAVGEQDIEDWLYSFRVNTIAPIALATGLLKNLKKSKESPVIAALTSKMGSIADNTSGGAYIYRSSKAALNAAFRSLALDLQDADVSLLLLHPGWVQTEMGGQNALITVTESVRGMRSIIDSNRKYDTGTFWAYDGKAVPW